MLLLLEDSPDRVRRMLACWMTIAPSRPALAWADAHQMIADLPTHLPAATLISLDHDLISDDASLDLGDGVDVARFLAGQRLRSPVIVHSSHADRASIMMGELQLAHLAAARVLPVGDDWIESDWMLVARLLLLHDSDPAAK